MRPVQQITDKERDFCRHALGLSRSKIGYRNYYAACDGDGVAIGRGLVSKGYAVEVQTGSHLSNVNFMITHAGFKAVAQQDEKMDEKETAKMARIDLATG